MYRQSVHCILKNIRSSLKSFFKEHPEYKIVHSHINSLSTFVLNAAKKSCPTRIAHSHIAITPITLSTFVKSRQSLTNNIKDLIHLMLRKSLRKNATHYFACGEKAAEWMYGNNPDKEVSVIYNAIDTNKFSYKESVSLRVKEQLNISDSLVIGHVGRFHDQKNHTFIIKIFKELLTKESNAKLVLIGVGDLKEVIEDEATKLNIINNILFLGARKDINELLQAMDLFLFPSLFEGLPVTLIEAQAAGLKIISSNNVSKEIELTDLVEFVSLDEPATFWADKLLLAKNYKRQKTQNTLLGYDIGNNASKLQSFYLSNQ